MKAYFILLFLLIYTPVAVTPVQAWVFVDSAALAQRQMHEGLRKLDAALHLTQITATVAQVMQVVQQAKMLYTYLQDPKKILEDLTDLDNLIALSGATTGEDSQMTQDLIKMREVKDEAMGIYNDVKDTWSDVKGMVDEAGKPIEREVSFYEALSASQNLANMAKKGLKQEQESRKNLSKQLTKALDVKGANSKEKIDAAQLKVQALAAQEQMMTNAKLAAREDARILKEEMEIKAEVQNLDRLNQAGMNGVTAVETEVAFVKSQRDALNSKVKVATPTETNWVSDMSIQVKLPQKNQQ